MTIVSHCLKARALWLGCLAASILFLSTFPAFGEETAAARPPELGYDGDLIRFPGPYAFDMPAEGIILITDQELLDLSDPDKVLNLTLTHDERKESLRQICERGKARGCKRLVIAFDYFFKQYRPGADTPRQLTCDMDEFIQRIAAVAKFAQGYGMGLELSLLSPLEIGTAFQKATGESGAWMQYRKGLRDPKTGAYSVELWQQKRWANNKGPIDIVDAGVRVFAFSEKAISGTPYRVVNPDGIREITATSQVEAWDSERKSGDFRARRIRVYGQGVADAEGLDRVLVVQSYRVPEMDYFSANAPSFLHGLVDKYADAGVILEGLYSDEMHIQQDWSYHSHHDNGEFTVRYVSAGFQRAFAQQYGAQYADFAKYLIYFTHGQEDTASDLSAKRGIMHVMGSSPEDVQATAQLRARYYHFLQDNVVNLFTDAKHYAESRMGHRLMARAHATWAQSPTIDSWDTGRDPSARHQYEYTSDFVWSNTVQQASSACYDYFKWGDYLTGNGTDHAEGGWLDRDYYAIALACSMGILNEVPMAYAAHWGSPGPIGQRYAEAVSAYGASGSPMTAIVQDLQHRDTEVLMLYPIDLVAADERFGSWMTQYGYADYVTQAKLLERGEVRNGAIEMAGRHFTTLVALFEPFPSEKLLGQMETLAAQGGRVVWSGPPPLLDSNGAPVLERWAALFGVEAKMAPAATFDGLRAPGVNVRFEGPLAAVPAQTILTDFMPDRVYPVIPLAGTEVSARLKDQVVGTVRHTPTGGSLACLAFRPRDDQSQSLGYEMRTWFEALNALGSYPSSGTFTANDNPQVLSRTTDYLVCGFPNGTIALTPHFRTIEEGWPGGFARTPEQDQAYMTAHPIPPSTIQLRGFQVAGHTVTYEGTGVMAYRLDPAGRLLAFSGSGRAISIDGADYELFGEGIGLLSFAPVPENRKKEGGAQMIAMVHGTGTVSIPCTGLPAAVRVVAQGVIPGSADTALDGQVKNNVLRFTSTPEVSGRWLYVVAPAG